MIQISRWRALGAFFAEAGGINSFIYGAQDEDILAKVENLNQRDYPVLVGILPTILGTGSNLDQMGHESPLFFYCMVPRKTNMSDEEMDEAWETTLDGIKGIEETIKQYCNSAEWLEFYHVKPDSIHIDPEFGLWELMGWSIGFEIEHED
jgi:hypothetical protein